MFRNAMPRYEILSADAMETLDRGWKRIVSEIGVEFMSDRALDLFRAAGQTVEDNNVKFDPDFILEQVAKAPREFDVQARNPANTIHVGGDSMSFGGVYGPPFVRVTIPVTRPLASVRNSVVSTSRRISTPRRIAASRSAAIMALPMTSRVPRE